MLSFVNSARTHTLIDQVNTAQDRIIAAKLRRDHGLLRLAQSNLQRWIAADGRRVRAVFREWQAVLHRLDAREIADFLTSDTPMARRLRQSSPFAGALTRAECHAVRRRYAKAGA